MLVCGSILVPISREGVSSIEFDRGGLTMPDKISRRETLRRGLAATSLLALLRDLPVPALAQGDTDVPFTDLPANFNPSANLNGATRQYDIRKIDGMLTPKEQFFTTQHLG